MSKRGRIIALSAALLLCLGAITVLVSMDRAAGTMGLDAPVAVQAPNVGGPIALTDQNGQAFKSGDVKAPYKILFFGFTHCPAICPTELQKITQALKALGDDAGNFQPIFVTVDPERDTPEVLKEYVALYDPRLIGLTGTKDEIEATKALYRVYGAKTMVDGASDYTVDHSSFIYVTGQDDKVVDLFKAEDSAKVVALRLRHLLSEQP